MEKQVEVTVLGDAPGKGRRIHWLICDNGMTLAEGHVQCDTNAVISDWQDLRPPAEYEGQVRFAIARVMETARAEV